MVQSLVALRDRREQVIAQVSDGYATELYEVEELERRLDLAHAARTVDELELLVADLAPVSSTALVPVASTAIDDPRRVPSKRLRVIMGAVEREGRWTVPSRLEMRMFWSSAVLDFREASFGPGVTTLDIRVTMASLELILPPHLAVDVDVSSIAGAVEERHRVPPEADPARPFLQIVGSVRFGSLEITTRLPGESRRQASKRERRERKQLEHSRKLLDDGRSR
ncbi:MAG: hypothetical protein WKG01_42095 [Kofleriaceae bacterium]